MSDDYHVHTDVIGAVPSASPGRAPGSDGARDRRYPGGVLNVSAIRSRTACSSGLIDLAAAATALAMSRNHARISAASSGVSFWRAASAASRSVSADVMARRAGSGFLRDLGDELVGWSLFARACDLAGTRRGFLHDRDRTVRADGDEGQGHAERDFGQRFPLVVGEHGSISHLGSVRFGCLSVESGGTPNRIGAE